MFRSFGLLYLQACLSAALLAAGPAAAWSNHALATRPALAPLTGLAASASVEVESIERFLAAQGQVLKDVLDEHERWAREHLPDYPPRPDALRFEPGEASDPADLRRRFLAALRLAPDARIEPYLQRLPGESAEGRPMLPGAEVTTLRGDRVVARSQYVRLAAGDRVSPADVLSTASDEPDYGMDLGLWADNGTAHGRAYGFGPQPFGNPALAFSSQAPIHMGFWHESPIVSAAAPFLKRALPEYRITLFTALARHALRAGHEYWGWRFAGWALHYIQDLTQPYHARVLPGLGTARMLWINALSLASVTTPMAHAVTLVSNRHLALENLQRNALLAGHGDRPGAPGDAAPQRLLAALAGGPDADPPASFAWDQARTVVARHAAASADSVDRTIAGALPARFVRDPGHEFGVDGDELDLFGLLASENPAARDAMIDLLVPLMSEYGAHTRAFVRALRGEP